MGAVVESFASAAEHARALKSEIRQREGLTCSVGIGPNKLVAKVASDFEQPDGLTVVELALYTERPRLFARLWALPGVRRWQTGDRDARVLVPVDRLPDVAGLIRARRRRRAGSAAHLQKVPDPPYSATSRLSEAGWRPGLGVW